MPSDIYSDPNINSIIRDSDNRRKRMAGSSKGGDEATQVAGTKTKYNLIGPSEMEVARKVYGRVPRPKTAVRKTGIRK